MEMYFKEGQLVSAGILVGNSYNLERGWPGLAFPEHPRTLDIG